MLNRLKEARAARNEIRSFGESVKLWERASSALGAIAAAHKCIADEASGARNIERSGNVIDISGTFDPRTNNNTAQRYLDEVKRQPSHVKLINPSNSVEIIDLSETI